MKYISRDKLIDILKEKDYEFFVDEVGRLVSINYLVPLLAYKYITIDDMWSFWIEDDTLHMKNMCGMGMYFPLKKEIGSLKKDYYVPPLCPECHRLHSSDKQCEYKSREPK